MVRVPEHCPHGHRLMSGRMLLGSIAGSCGQAHHLAMRLRRVTYGARLVNGCSLLDGREQAPRFGPDVGQRAAIAVDGVL
jgi:hypothetical protein